MDLRIGEITAPQLKAPGQIARGSNADAAEGAESFADYLNGALNQLSTAEKAAQDMATAFALGEPVEVHDVMLAFGKAELGLRLFLQLRNKVIEAYQEIMRMPV